MDSNDKQTEIRLRDFGLVLVGYALSSEESRKHLFGMVEPADFPVEISKLMEAIQTADVPTMRGWLNERGAKLEQGIKAIDAIGKAVRDYTRRTARRKLVEEIRGASKVHILEDEYLVACKEIIGRYEKLLEREL
jgi:hypothetical protein